MTDGISIIVATFYLILAIGWLIAWGITLMHQAIRRKWVWFWITLLIQFTLIIYWIIWMIYPNFRKK